MKKLTFILPFLFVFTPLFAQAALTATFQGEVGKGLGTYSSPLCSSLPEGTGFTNRRILVEINSGASYLSGLLTDVLINGVSVGSNKVILSGGGNGTGSGSFQGITIWAWLDDSTTVTGSADLTFSRSANGSGNWTCVVYTFDKTLAATAP